MKFSKILLACAAFAALAFAEEAKPEEAKPEETKPEVNAEEEASKVFSEPKIKNGYRTKEQCEQGYQLLQTLYLEIEKNPKCTYNKEYAEENGYTGDYTMDIKNRDYFCTECLTKYLRLGNPMVNACGNNAPNEMVYDLYFLSSVNAIICAKDKLHNKYCETVMDELFEKEGNKPVINWKEDSLCGECPYYYHDIFKEREEFYQSVLKDSTETSFIGRLLPLRDIDIECFKLFDEKKQEAMKEAKKNAEAQAEKTKNINYNEILEEAQKEEQAMREQEEKERKEKKEKKETEENDEEKAEEKTEEKAEEKTEEKTEEKAEEKAEEKTEEKAEEKVEEKTEEKAEKPKKASEAGEL